MKFGAHLPVIDFDRTGWTPNRLSTYVDAARDAGFDFICSNDHFVYQRPWLDGLVALSSVIERSGTMQLITTVALPVLRGPVALAKTAAAIDTISGGRLILGVGPGSSQRDYDLVGLDFTERWRLFDASLKQLRAHLTNVSSADSPLEPRPARAGGTPIWIGSWGSEASLRRVARYGDGWLASGYNTTPAKLAAARKLLHAELIARGRDADTVTCSLSTVWTYITEDEAAANRQREMLAKLLNRPVDDVAEQALIGPPAQCRAMLAAYAAAGVDNLFAWPLADEVEQLQRFMRLAASFEG